MNYYKKIKSEVDFSNEDFSNEDRLIIKSMISTAFPDTSILSIHPMTTYRGRAFNEAPKTPLQGAVVDILGKGMKRKTINVRKEDGSWRIVD